MQNQKNLIVGALILGISIIILGFSLKSAIDNFTNKDRKVTVKGLAETEVKADKVTWPIVTKELGNELTSLYNNVDQTQKKVISFLKENGVKDAEISVNPPTVVDREANQYNDAKNANFRFIATSSITVTSHQVDHIREIIAKQGELLKMGVGVVAGDYENNIVYDYVSFNDMKPKMMEEAIDNARKTADQFAKNSKSTLDKIITADQGQFTITNVDASRPYIKSVRVVTTITYSLKN